ncbi:MAG: hypothetical protein MZU97_08615 [Bacillus subtilis]|nr:hypothetical protein [Bacillus subtilis]
MWVHGEAEKDAYGQIATCWGAAQDITERVEMNQRMAESEEKYRLLYQSMAQGLARSTRSSPTLPANPSITSIWTSTTATARCLA